MGKRNKSCRKTVKLTLPTYKPKERERIFTGHAKRDGKIPDRYAYITVGRIERVSEKAILCYIEDEKIWIPRKFVENDHEFREGMETIADDDVLVGVHAWFANEHGLSD